MNDIKTNFENMHPDPTFERPDWQSLCGKWEFEFAPGESLPEGKREINVPFSYETEYSGVGIEKPTTEVRYCRDFEVKPFSGSVLMHFAAVDYRCEVWINETYAGGHVGGYTSFYFDVTKLVRVGVNRVRVVAYDSLSKAQLRGKQRALEQSYECWYVQTTGIWQDVWLEYAGANYVESLSIAPEEDGNVRFSVKTSLLSQKVSALVRLNGKTVAAADCVSENGVADFCVNVGSPALWSDQSPTLYRVEIASEDDVVFSYFGIRSLSTQNGKVLVNGEQTYLKMVLEQGYWRGSGMTAPGKEALYREVELIKSLGFNGVRMHQKTECASFYYFCDLLGLYVWGEMPSNYEDSLEAQAEMLRDCPLIIKQLSSHPSIIAWVIFNESWGVPHVRNDADTQRYVEKVCEKAREADGTRFIISNDGWHVLDGDLTTLHEYNQNARALASDYADKDAVVGNRLIINTFGYAYADGYAYCGQPVIISEFGGIAIDESEGWGYGDKARDKQAFFTRLKAIFEAIYSIDYLAGFCYTQITDVEQETNGLCYADRTPKIDAKKIRSVVSGK